MKVYKQSLSFHDNKYFLYVGNAYPHKNLERAIRAIVLLNRENEEKVLLLIVSSRGVFSRKLEKFIKKNHFEEFVKLLGFVEEEELKQLYKKSVGFVFPSLMEGFGLPGLEAMKAGTIVLCSYIKVFLEIYLNNAIYFDPLDVQSMVSAMKRVLTLGKAERKKKIENEKEFIKRYSWEKMARETLGVYKSVLISGK